jgi:peptide/nickel transport system ATP-binding protein
VAQTTLHGQVLCCEKLSCEFQSARGPVRILHDVDLSIAPRTALGVVGESGAGKSMLVKTIMGIAPVGMQVTGRIELAGVGLTELREDKKRALIGRKVGMVFQNPMTSLNPFVRIGRQLDEASRLHLGLGKAEARARAVELLASVGIPDPAECYRHYPHQFSGGMRQRIMIATALACRPDLLIADEATTALDVTVQKDILDLLQLIQIERQMAMILVTHNLGVVVGRTDEILVLYGGHVVEYGPTEQVFSNPRHRYTAALLSAIPRMDQPAHSRLHAIPGRPPNLMDPPPGCPFAPRCPAAEGRCHRSMPPMTVSADGRHRFACHVPVAPSGEQRPSAGPSPTERMQ